VRSNLVHGGGGGGSGTWDVDAVVLMQSFCNQVVMRVRATLLGADPVKRDADASVQLVTTPQNRLGKTCKSSLTRVAGACGPYWPQ
jgi:hypothetical protein